MVTKRNITPGQKWHPGKTKRLILDPNNKAIRYEPTKKGSKFKSMNGFKFFLNGFNTFDKSFVFSRCRVLTTGLKLPPYMSRISGTFVFCYSGNE